MRLPPLLQRTAAAALACSLPLSASRAAAHIELQQPLARYSNANRGGNEACPCGAGTTSRRCNDPATFSDPARSLDRATTFAPGETITVRFSENVGHEGRYRIAFDPDGADLGDFNQNVLLDEVDPAGAAGNLGEGTTWELQVTLPDITCDNCTLQLLQVIDGNTTEPVVDPSRRGEAYFQCADIVLQEGTPAGGIPPMDPGVHLAELVRPGRPAAMDPGSTPPPEPDATPASMAGDGGSGSNVSRGSTAPEGGVPSSHGDGSDGDGSCSLGPRPPARASLAALGLLGVSLAVLLRRRSLAAKCADCRPRAATLQSR